MRIYYISPSQMPSRSANSIHVIRMCEAFSSLGHNVTLFVNQTIKQSKEIKEVLENYYGVTLRNVKIISFYSPLNRAMNLQIAFVSVCYLIFEILKGSKPDVVVSRNLYASFFLHRLLKDKLIYETHEIECGLRKYFQTTILKYPLPIKVFISNTLLKLLSKHHDMNILNSVTLPDAARLGIKQLSKEQRQEIRSKILSDKSISYNHFAGYFGSLYKGHGIEIIQILAGMNPDVAFLVYGGNEEQIFELRKTNKTDNLKIMGYIDPYKVQDIMGAMDVLLMPYQQVVLIGRKRFSDIGSYLSPMKMFEYMASCIPIISSRLPILEEVLKDGKNCLLATHDQPSNWTVCLSRLLNDTQLSRKLAENAYSEYLNRYNWQKRAQIMLNRFYE
jgi:glycosyltransferase involved in cell wall biosynthesis